MDKPQKALPRRPDIFGEVYRPAPGAYIRETGNQHLKSLITPTSASPAAKPIQAPSTTIAPRHPKPVTMSTTKHIPAKPQSRASKPSKMIEEHATPYRPEPLAAVLSDPGVPRYSLENLNLDQPKPVRVILQTFDEVVICDDPVPDKRAKPDLKHQADFDKMKPGQGLICDPKRIGVVAGSLRIYLQRRGIDAKVKSMKHHPKDRLGRVWWLA